MSEDGTDERTLDRNCVKNFILRIDLIKNNMLAVSKIANAMAAYFDRIEKRQIKSFTLDFTKGNSASIEQEVFDFVLVSETNSVSMTFSELQNAFWIECSQYKNNSVYKEIIKNLVEEVLALCNETEAKRIGLRYINEFNCDKIKNINRIYGNRLSLIVKAMINENSQSRVIGMEEYNNDGYKLRLHYGVPNKFYPSVITVCNLLLDIDSFIESKCNVNDWQEIITQLNHSAYEQFIKLISPKYLEELK